MSVMQIIPCLAILSKKTESDCQKNPYFMRKTKIYSRNTPNDLEELHPDFWEEAKVERPVEDVGVFSQNLGITAYTLENYSNFKSNCSFNNGSILEYIMILELGEMPVLIVCLK